MEEGDGGVGDGAGEGEGGARVREEDVRGGGVPLLGGDGERAVGGLAAEGAEGAGGELGGRDEDQWRHRWGRVGWGGGEEGMAWHVIDG